MMRRVRRTIYIMAAATAALNAVPACAKDSASKQPRGPVDKGGMALSRIAILAMGPENMASTGLTGTPASLCRDCDYEETSVRKFLPGEMTLKFQPVGGTFSLHF
ncbi:hypothetical protein BH10PSE13_BH10PSE13_15050 [soil metagenome]